MSNKLCSIISTTLVIFTSVAFQQTVIIEEPSVPKKKSSIIQPLEGTAHAQEQEIASVVNEQPSIVYPSGSCEDWMSQAGIPINNASKTLILNESGCRPNAVNPSSGACGIPQALPCSKLPCTLEDPVCQLKWMNEYVTTRYSTWENALSFWGCIGNCYSNYGLTYKSTTWY